MNKTYQKEKKGAKQKLDTMFPFKTHVYIRDAKNHTMLFFVQFTHYSFIVLCLAAVPLVVINEPFWISAPILGLILHLGFSRTLECPWTRLENYYRRKCDKPQIKTFIGHFLFISGMRDKKSYFE